VLFNASSYFAWSEYNDPMFIKIIAVLAYCQSSGTPPAMPYSSQALRRRFHWRDE